MFEAAEQITCTLTGRFWDILDTSFTDFEKPSVDKVQQDD